jgi:hypothetical protein
MLITMRTVEASVTPDAASTNITRFLKKIILILKDCVHWFIWTDFT